MLKTVFLNKNMKNPPVLKTSPPDHRYKPPMRITDVTKSHLPDQVV